MGSCLPAPLRTKDGKRCAPLAALGAGWGATPDAPYTPSPTTAPHRPQPTAAPKREMAPTHRKRLMPITLKYAAYPPAYVVCWYTLEERAAGRVRDRALYATGRARTGCRIIFRLRGGRGAINTLSTHVIPSFQHATERPKSLGTLAGSCRASTQRRYDRLCICNHAFTFALLEPRKATPPLWPTTQSRRLAGVSMEFVGRAWISMYEIRLCAIYRLSETAHIHMTTRHRIRSGIPIQTDWRGVALRRHTLHHANAS